MTEPTRAQREQVARGFWKMGKNVDYLPSWDRPDFLWPLLEVLKLRGWRFLPVQSVRGGICWAYVDESETDFELWREAGTLEHAVWSVALAATGER